MYKIVYLDLAIMDMENITGYISHSLCNKTAALKLADEFLKTTQRLVEFPYKNAEFVSTKKLEKKYRSIKVKNYIMFYTINEENKTLTIARVLYKKRNLEYFLD